MRDIDIRTALHEQTIPAIAAEPGSLVLDELGLCQGDARIDIAVINGSLHGFEIKSERDTLERLPGQEEIYSKILDTVTLVISDSHLEKAKELIPDWWGIIRVTGNQDNVVLNQDRPTKYNDSVDPYSLAQLLWRDEALAALEAKGLDKGVRSKPRKFIWQALAERVPLADLSLIVRSTLKQRKTWRAGQQRK